MGDPWTALKQLIQSQKGIKTEGEAKTKQKKSLY